MPTSANATYYAVPAGGGFNYAVLLRNTSVGPPVYSVYALMFGAHFNAPLTVPFPLHNIVFISSPANWFPSLTNFSLNYFTNFAGSAAASGYILPGHIGAFTFQSSTAPPKSMPFGCCFYNDENEWGFCYNGTAALVDCIPAQELPLVALNHIGLPPVR